MEHGKCIQDHSSTITEETIRSMIAEQLKTLGVNTAAKTEAPAESELKEETWNAMEDMFGC